MNEATGVYMIGGPDPGAMVTLAFLAVLYGVMAIFLFLGYLLKGFGMYRIAKANDIPNAWLSFVPIASNYMQGELAGPVTLGKKEVKRLGVWTLLVPILSGIVLSVLAFVMMGALIIPMALSGALYNEPTVGAMGIFFVFYFIFIIAAVILGALQQAVFGVSRFYTHLRYTDKGKAVLHMILGLMIPLYQPIYYFVLGKRQPITEAPKVTEAVLTEPTEE